MSMTKREKRLVVILLIFVVFFVYYMLFLKPYLDDMTKINNKIAQDSVKVENNLANQESNNALIERITLLEQQVGELSIGISQGFDQPPMLVYLEDTINKHAKKMTFSFENVSQNGQLFVCPVTVTMQSTYEGIKNILSELAQGAYFVKVVELKVENGGVSEVTTTQMTEDGETVPVTTVVENDLNVSLKLEFFSIAGDVPADTVYSFDDNLSVGGDIFK